MPIFFNQPTRRNTMPYFQNQNNMRFNQGFIPDLSNPYRPFADEEKNEKIITKIDSTISDGICEFMQNEKNASKYYDKLAEKTNLEKNKKILYNISKNAAEEINYAKKICSSLSIKIKEPTEKNINTSVTFLDGISLALEEENNALNNLSSMIENSNGEISQKITPLILRKFSRVNNLYLILYQRRNSDLD